MHYHSLVYGPRTLAELNDLLQDYGSSDKYTVMHQPILGVEPKKLNTTIETLIAWCREYSWNDRRPTVVLTDLTRLELNTQLDASETHSEADIIIGYDDDEMKTFCLIAVWSKWDWWVVGGRWPGALKLKPGVTDLVQTDIEGRAPATGLPEVDVARLRDIDWEAMENESARNYIAQYDLISHFADKHPSIEDLFIRKHGYQEASQYLFQFDLYKPFYESFKAERDALGDAAAKIWSWTDLIGYTREQVIERAKLRVYSGLIGIIRGAEPEMVDFSEMPCNRLEAYRQFKARVDALDPDTVVTSIDMHN